MIQADNFSSKFSLNKTAFLEKSWWNWKFEKFPKDEIEVFVVKCLARERDQKLWMPKKRGKNPLANQQACQIRRMKASCKKETNETKTDIEMKIKKSKDVIFLKTFQKIFDKRLDPIKVLKASLSCYYYRYCLLFSSVFFTECFFLFSMLGNRS